MDTNQNLSTHPEPENQIDQYDVAVTKDAWVIVHLKKGKTSEYAKTVFYFLRGNPISTAGIYATEEKVNLEDGQGLEIPCTILFKGEEKYI